MVILIKHWYRHKEHPFPLEMHTVLYTYFFLYVTIFLVFIYIWIERQWIVEVEISKMWKRLFFSPCSHFSNALYPLSLLICNTEHLHSWFKSSFTRYYLQDAKFYIMSNSKAGNQFGQIYKFRTMRKTLLCFNASFFPSANHFVKAFPHNFQGWCHKSPLNTPK